jgi:thioredoxin 1
MSIVYAKTDNFNETISSGLVLVDFYADWCGPCKMIAPVLEQIAGERADLKIVKLNVDEESQVAQKFGVMSIPTLILFKDGTQIAQTLGFKPKDQLLSWIESNR